jgi:hypothetical protein
MSFYVTVFAGSAPLGGLFAGAVAEAFGSPVAFGVGAVLSMVTIGLVAYGLRRAAARGPLGVTTLGAPKPADERRRSEGGEPVASATR